MTEIAPREGKAEARTDGSDRQALIAAHGIGLVRSGRVILEGVDIAIHAGEIVTLIGPNGAGKTSLVRILLGLERPDSGELRRRRGLRVGYLPQRFSVDPAIPLSVARFLTLGVRAGAAAIETVLDEVGAAHLADSQVSTLSGGEFQRVALARALIGKPDLLVLDEPVRGVDFTGAAALYGLIGRIRDTHGCGVLLVSHDLHVVMGASDRVVCLNRHVCCSGQPRQVARHPDYVRLFGPEPAEVLGVYRHEHDHAHDLDGSVCGAAQDAREAEEGGGP